MFPLVHLLKSKKPGRTFKIFQVADFETHSEQNSIWSLKLNLRQWVSQRIPCLRWIRTWWLSYVIPVRSVQEQVLQSLRNSPFSTYRLPNTWLFFKEEKSFLGLFCGRFCLRPTLPNPQNVHIFLTLIQRVSTCRDSNL